MATLASRGYSKSAMLRIAVWHVESAREPIATSMMTPTSSSVSQIFPDPQVEPSVEEDAGADYLDLGSKHRFPSIHLNHSKPM